MQNKNHSVGIVSPFGQSTNTASFLERLVAIESSIPNNLYVVAPDKVWQDNKEIVFRQVKYQVGDNPLSQIANQISAQIRMAVEVARLARSVNYWIFYGGDVLLLPALVARIYGTRVFLALAGNLEKEVELKSNILNRPQLALRKTVLFLSTRIILYSRALVSQWHLGRYSNKIIIADNHFVNLTTFRNEPPVQERENLVGYIGRLSEEKGVLNLVEAIPQILGRKPDTRFLIVGDGPLRNKIREYLNQERVQRHVEMVDRVPRDAVPSYLNRLKLCVLPSYTEGMPNIVLEAMACGAPVLATSVGAVPELVEDGRTGFIMEDNSPECIAKNVLRSLNDSGLTTIAISARAFIEEHFTFEAAVRSFTSIS